MRRGMPPYRLVLIGCSFSLLLTGYGCAFFSEMKTLMKRMEGAPPREKVVPGPVEEFFVHVDRLFQEGRYRQALRRVWRIYQESEARSVREEALYRVVLILSYGDNPNRNDEEAEKKIQLFRKEFPESARMREIQWVSLLLQRIRRGEAEIKTLRGYNAIQEGKIHRLQEDIRKIKEIDLQLEEHKKKLE